MDYNDKKLKLKELTEQFHKNVKQYKSNIYDEANTRVDFIDKFFMLLDWDVTNNQGFSENYREVIREDKIQIEGKQKAPDYSFRIGGTRKFFVEAKKPSVNVKEDIEPAFQVRRYGYTAKLPLSILTDFEEFSIYDTRIKPDKTDKASVGRVFICNYEEYEKHFDFIYNTFSKNAILKGSFDKYIEENKNKKGTSEVDKELLKLVEDWRTELAKNIALRNNDIDIYNLNNAVQKIIDRIIFLRIAEDKEIENYESLLQISKNTNIYEKLNQLFLKANNKYNAGLFLPDDWLSNIKIDDKILSSIIKGLYYPECPYEFSILPIEILGNIYEQFLGKTIRFKNVKDGHTAVIEEKPEVRKAGGVYYTPQYIVNYIVENTVGEKIKNKSPEDIAGNKGLKPLAILDPACGSGSFLVGAYSYLLNYHLDYYTNPPVSANKGLQPLVSIEEREKWIKKWLKESKIYQIPHSPFDKGGAGRFKLTIEEKQKILINNIYGVDIDSQAVEVTKLSLYLKLLENESTESKDYLFSHTDIKLLPSLDKNIKCGNSLIGSDFYKEKDMTLFGNDEMRKVNVFDWEKEFPDIFKRKEKKLKAFHVTWATHNSRVSERMIEYNIKTGEPFLFSNDHEITITKIIKDIVLQENYKILAFNICKDHIHILIICEKDELPEIMKMIKGKSSQKFKEYLEIPAEEEFHLWARKFDTKDIENDNQFNNTITYIRHNREKHQLPENSGLQPAVTQMTCSYEEAFDQYENGGFDVVIGNPPYVNIVNIEDKEIRDYLMNKFKTAKNKSDLYSFFTEKSVKILKKDGVLGFIFSNSWLSTDSFSKFREFLINETKIIELVKLPLGVFKDATVTPVLIFLRKEKCKINTIKLKYFENGNFNNFSYGLDYQRIIDSPNYCFSFDSELKIKIDTIKLGDIADFSLGIKTSCDEIFVLEDKKDDSSYKLLRGKDISKYSYAWNGKWIWYRPDLMAKRNGARPRVLSNFLSDEKILIKDISKDICATIDNDKYLVTDTVNFIYKIQNEYSLKFILGIINSYFINYWFKKNFEAGLHIKNNQLQSIPIPKNVDKQAHDLLTSLVNQMLDAQKQFHNANTDNDKKIFKQKIEIIDKQIDELVYKFYGLTEEEIKIVEGINE